jgi:hypothetical protein
MTLLLYRHCAAESYNGAIFLQKLSSAAPVGYTRLQGAQRSRVTQHPPPLMRTTVVVWAKILIRESERERENAARRVLWTESKGEKFDARHRSSF